MRPPLRLALVTLVIVLAAGLALALALDGPTTKDLPESPPPGTGDTSSSNAPSTFDGAPIPDQSPQNFTLINQDGRRVSLSSYRGRVVILTFLSTASADTSRLMAEQIRGALDELGTDVPALAVSTDPQVDTRARVRAFLRRVSLTGRLEYLTGTPATLSGVWRTYAITPHLATEKSVDRSAYVLLIDQRGVQRVRFFVEQLTPEGLVHDIHKLER